MINPANGQRLSYGEIAAFGTIPSPLPAVDAKELKARKDFRLIGKSVPRRDTPSKVNGTAQYAIDVKLPGMVYASTLHSPVHNAQPKSGTGKQDQSAAAPESWNDAEVKAMKGVIGIVKLPNGLAVVADHFENAKAGRDALKVNWTEGQGRRLQLRAARSKDYVKIHDDPNAQAATARGEGRREGGVRRRGQDLQRRVPQRLRLPRADGAAERGGPHQRRRRQGRGLGRQPGARRISRKAVAKALGLQGGAGRLPPVLHGRRLRPALARRLRRPNAR